MTMTVSCMRAQRAASNTTTATLTDAIEVSITDPEHYQGKSSLWREDIFSIFLDALSRMTGRTLNLVSLFSPWAIGRPLPLSAALGCHCLTPSYTTACSGPPRPAALNHLPRRTLLGQDAPKKGLIPPDFL